MYNVLTDCNLSKNFKLSEFVCHDGSNNVIIVFELVQKLQALREKIGKPIQVVGAYRTPEYNAKCGGAPRSQHLYGKAADIKVSGMTPYQIAVVAETVGFKGIGIYTHDGNNFVHCDVREIKSYWKDASNHKLIAIKTLKEAY